MAIIANFDGASLRVPGAYSSIKVKQTGAGPLAETGIVGIIGEARKGEPGATSGIREFDSSTLADLVAIYGTGPIVDAARVLVNASNDARITNGANRILVYKTNASTQATSILNQDTSNPWGTLASLNYGAEENLINYQFEEDTAETWNLEFGADWTATPANDLTLKVNGGTLVTLAGASMTSAAATVTEINTKLNTALGTVGIVYASTVVDRISIDLMATGTEAPRHGMGISLEFNDDAEYTDIGVTAGQRGIAIVAGSDATSISATNPTRTVTINRQSDGITESSDDSVGEIGGQIHLEIGCVAATSCTLTITNTTLTTDATGAGAGDLSISLADYNTLADLAEFIDSQTGYSCSVPANINSALPPTVLDNVTTVGISAIAAGEKPGQVKADSYVLKTYFDQNSGLVVLTETLSIGLPDVIAKTFLAGGTLGATTTSNVDAGFSAFEGIRVNTVIPLFSQDASDDLVEDGQYTDSSSTYDIESIHTLCRNHCKKMSNTQNRSERNGYVGYRGTFEQIKNQARILGTEFISLCPLDVQVLNADGELQYLQPHIGSCIVAGLQAGSEVGEPATFKFVAVNGIKHLKKQGVTPLITEKLDPSLLGHKNQSIDAGVTLFEAPSSGGVRVLLHNTTYGRDSNFVFNRVHVLEAAHYVAFDLRKNLEDTFTGTKAITGSAETIRNFVIARAKVYLDANIIVGDDTNKGLGFKNLAVRISGNVAEIDIVITPVVGIDFILSRIVLDSIKQSA